MAEVIGVIAKGTMEINAKVNTVKSLKTETLSLIERISIIAEVVQQISEADPLILENNIYLRALNRLATCIKDVNEFLDEITKKSKLLRIKKIIFTDSYISQFKDFNERVDRLTNDLRFVQNNLNKIPATRSGSTSSQELSDVESSVNLDNISKTDDDDESTKD